MFYMYYNKHPLSCQVEISKHFENDSTQVPYIFKFPFMNKSLPNCIGYYIWFYPNKFLSC